MKKLLRVVLAIVVVLVAIVAVGALYISNKSLPNYQADIPAPQLSITATPEMELQGKALAYQACAGCHKHNQEQFAGGAFEDVAANATFGTIYVPNITQHAEYGIGRYTDGELYRLLRTGIKKDGTLMLPVMPIWPNAAEEDIHAIIAYFRSNDPAVLSVAKKPEVYQPSLLATFLQNVVFAPTPFQDSYPEKRPAVTNAVDYGEYLVNDALGCYHCHSAGLDSWDLLNPENTPGHLRGGAVFQLPDYQVTAPSIIPDGSAELTNWSEDEFIGAIKHGVRPGKPAYRYPMHPYPYLDTIEVKAMLQYLQSYAA
ncbi:MAG: c-type cytochrome, partial [Bacteroidota bacterium]